MTWLVLSLTFFSSWSVPGTFFFSPSGLLAVPQMLRHALASVFALLFPRPGTLFPCAQLATYFHPSFQLLPLR